MQWLFMMSVFFSFGLQAAVLKNNFPVPHESPSLEKKYEFFLAQTKNEKLNYQERWTAVTGLSQLNPLRSVRDLRALLDAKPWFLRNAALLALDSVDPTEARAAALKLLSDKALVVRGSAVQVLDKNLDSRSRKRLWNELSATYNFRKNASLSIRSQIMKVLAHNPLPSEKNDFLRFEADKDAQVASLAKSVAHRLF